MSITIDDHHLPFDTHNTYTVHIDPTTSINTLLTFCPLKVTEWITTITSSTTPLLIGLDIEWRPNRSCNQDNPAATLQLCVSNQCLIFQLLYCPQDQFPQCLVDFLGTKESIFCGVGIEHDVEKLDEDYGLVIGGRIVDLGGLASERMDDKRLKKAGLKELARVVLGMEIQKPKSVSCSRWDQEWLYPEQVQYACVDAFLSYEIGRVLNAKPLSDLMKRRFSVSNGQRKHELKRDLANCVQTADMTVAEYFGKLEKLWDELSAYSPSPACICGQSEEYQRQKEEDKFHDFLGGLHKERFGNLRSQLLAQDPNPTLDRAFKAMRNEEQLQKSSEKPVISAPAEVMAFAVQSANKGTPTNTARYMWNPMCNNCYRYRVSMDDICCL